MLQIKFMNTCQEIAVRWMHYNTFDDKLALVRVIVWCRQATAIICANVDTGPCRHMASLGHN